MSDRFDEMFECLLYNDMLGFFITNYLIPPNQPGFKPGDSCVNQLLSITRGIYALFHKGYEVWGVLSVCLSGSPIKFICQFEHNLCLFIFIINFISISDCFTLFFPFSQVLDIYNSICMVKIMIEENPKHLRLVNCSFVRLASWAEIVG